MALLEPEAGDGLRSSLCPSDPRFTIRGNVATARVQTGGGRRRRRPRDGCVVPTDPLAELVRGFLSDWARTRPANPPRTTASSAAEVSFVAGEEWLAQESGVSRDRIQSIRQRRQPLTELRDAEALVAGALGRPDLFYDGTLPILPNPLASRAARASCCGSLTGEG